MPLPIPLNGFRGADAHAGTGFLVEDGTNAWLVTCVHIISGLKQTPPSLEPFSHGYIRVVGTPTVLRLFEGGAQRFSVVIIEPDNILADVMALRLTATEAAALRSYGAYELSAIVAPIQDEPVTATGFPGIQQTLIPSTTLSGHIGEIVGMSLMLTVPSATGYSGSALLGEGGLIGIVHGDVGVEPNFVNGLAISFEVVGPQLFT